jgi:hypothetical protein
VKYGKTVMNCVERVVKEAFMAYINLFIILNVPVLLGEGP